MIFRKHIEPKCSYCKSASSADSGMVICNHKGICAENGSCWRFSYDPLKRIPPAPRLPDFSKYDKSDYSL